MLHGLWGYTLKVSFSEDITWSQSVQFPIFLSLSVTMVYWRMRRELYQWLLISRKGEVSSNVCFGVFILVIEETKNRFFLKKINFRSRPMSWEIFFVQRMIKIGVSENIYKELIEGHQSSNVQEGQPWQ